MEGRLMMEGEKVIEKRKEGKVVEGREDTYKRNEGKL